MDRLEGATALARARELAPEIEAAADEIERTRRIPPALLDRLHAQRIFRMLLPRAVGGDEIDPVSYCAAVEEIGRRDGSIAWNVFVANSSALIAAYLDVEIARTVWGEPTTLVAWGPPNACGARAVPGGYRVSGRWDFASGCRAASWMGAHGHVVEPDGSMRLNRFGKPTVRSLLFPVSQVTLLDTWHTIGLRGTASDSYEVADVFVPEAFSTTREDPTLRRFGGRLYAFTQQGLYAVGVAAVAMGMARAMLDAFVELARHKAPRNIQPLAASSTVQAAVARAEARLGAARAYLMAILADIYEHADEVRPIDVPDRARARLACTEAIHAAIDVADYTYKAAGVDAIFPGTPFERRFRDMHTLSQQIQSRESHYEAVGHILLGGTPAVFL